MLLFCAAFGSLLSPFLPRVVGETCVLYSDINFPQYITFPDSNMIMGSFMVYSDSECRDEVSTLEAAPMGYVYKASQSAAAEYCSSMHGEGLLAFRDFTKYNSQRIWYCATHLPTGSLDDNGSPGPGPTSGDDTPEDAPVPKTCETLVQSTNLKMTATYGLGSGIQCNRIGAGGVFNSALSSQDVQDAVDIFGYAEQGYQLCYPHTGKIIFLDAATSPRAVVNVDYSHSGGFTCASLNRAGTVVLVGAAPDAVAPPARAKTQVITQYIRPGSYDPLSSAISLNGCTVTASTTLRLRAGPWGRLLGRVWGGSTVQAYARTRSWYKISYKGQEGWIAAWLSAAAGSCSGAGPGHAALPMVTLPSSYAAHLTGV